MDVDLSQCIVKCELDGKFVMVYYPITYDDCIIISITKKDGVTKHKNSFKERKAAFRSFISKSSVLIQAQLLTGKYLKYDYYYIDENGMKVLIGLDNHYLLDRKRYK